MWWVTDGYLINLSWVGKRICVWVPAENRMHARWSKQREFGEGAIHRAMGELRKQQGLLLQQREARTSPGPKGQAEVTIPLEQMTARVVGPG